MIQSRFDSHLNSKDSIGDLYDFFRFYGKFDGVRSDLWEFMVIQLAELAISLHHPAKQFEENSTTDAMLAKHLLFELGPFGDLPCHAIVATPGSQLSNREILHHVTLFKT